MPMLTLILRRLPCTKKLKKMLICTLFFNSSWCNSAYSLNRPVAKYLARRGIEANLSPQKQRRLLPFLLHISFFYGTDSQFLDFTSFTAYFLDTFWTDVYIMYSFFIKSPCWNLITSQKPDQNGFREAALVTRNPGSGGQPPQPRSPLPKVSF